MNLPLEKDNVEKRESFNHQNDSKSECFNTPHFWVGHKSHYLKQIN
jgi:hypothetical protein